MTWKKLKNIYINKNGKIVKINEHPYYRALINKDKDVYRSFILKSNTHQQMKETGSWCGFINLAKKIKHEGFDFDSHDGIIIKNKNDKWVCYHGRHRLCILYYLYGYKRLIYIDPLDKGRVIDMKKK